MANYSHTTGKLYKRKGKKMKKLTSIFLVACMVVGVLTGCGGEKVTSTSDNQNSESGTSTWSYSFTATTPLGDTHTAVEYWGKIFDELSERTNGRITGKIYPSSQLAGGDMATSLDMVQKGTIDIFVGGSTILGSYIPEFRLTNLAFVFPNNESCDGTLNDEEIMAFYNKESEAQGFHFLGWMENGWSEITNNKRELIKPSDLSGLVMRIPNGNDALIKAYESVGASAVNINLGELYTSLQQGVCDGEENGIAGAITSNMLYEVQKYMTYCQYAYGSFSCMMNDQLWNSIPAEDQALIQEVFEENATAQIQANRDAMEPCLKQVEDYGMVVHVMTDEEKAEWTEAMGPDSAAVKEILEGDEYDQDFVNLFLNKAKKYAQ